MHYYKRNLGDYAKKAGRLSMLQHGAYTLLLDACYDREKFPTDVEAIEWTWASTPEEEQAVRFVLSRFFELQTDGTYVQTRVYEEIQAYKIGEIQNRLIALSREAKKQGRLEFASQCDDLRLKIKNEPLQKTHEAWTHLVEELINQHERAPNHKPLTTNQEPLTNINTTAIAVVSSEPSSSKPPIDESPVFISIPTNKFNTAGEERPITENKIAEWQAVYPGVDVRQTLIRIRSWVVNNPAKRKTFNGIFRFIDTWLAKEQNNGSATYAASHQPHGNSRSAGNRPFAEIVGQQARDVIQRLGRNGSYSDSGSGIVRQDGSVVSEQGQV